jgi:broad specificity phosphatase PhoE
MKKYLIFVKHSSPEIVEDLPAREWKLSDMGRLRALQLADRLSEFQPEIIVSSTEPKATETAEIIATKHDLEFHTVDGLHEHDRSNTSYLSRDQFQGAIREFFEKPGVLVFGRETADEAHERFYQTVRSVLDCHPNETVVIVAHGTVISLFVSRLIGISDFLLWNELGLPSFVVIDTESNALITSENIAQGEPYGIH